MGGDVPAGIYWRVKRNPWESVKVAGAQWACRGWHSVRQTGATKALREGTCDETPFEASYFLFSIRNGHFVTKVTRKIVSFGLKRRKNCRFLPTARISP
jgi:hypothetical protein